MVQYSLPRDWIRYDQGAVAGALAEAKACILALQTTPYQKGWIESLQQIQLKREIAGTSRIEGADFTENELDAAMKASPEELRTRSQRQAHAAMLAYRWIATEASKRPLEAKTVLDLHRQLVTGADDDHCPPGELRRHDQNVTFGQPRHRGVEGGDACKKAFEAFADALHVHFPHHDVLIQALAAHYHLAAMHPFLDGNGRTARALEALILQIGKMSEPFFISMSNYYYDEKSNYLAALAEVRSNDHDITSFLVFGLKGVRIQCHRLLGEIRSGLSKALFRNLMYDLFNRLKSKRTRVLAERQLEILKVLLSTGEFGFLQLRERLDVKYRGLSNPHKAYVRDLNNLIFLKAIKYEKHPEDQYRFSVRLEWPTEITETEFFKQIRSLPKGKTYSFLQ